MSVTLNGHTFTTWDDVEKDIFTPEEIAEAELKAALVAEMVRARKENGITQQELEKRSGVRQPVIARMEKGNTHTQLDTVLKVLAAMGKTLAVVPISDSKPSTSTKAGEVRASS